MPFLLFFSLLFFSGCKSSSSDSSEKELFFSNKKELFRVSLGFKEGFEPKEELNFENLKNATVYLEKCKGDNQGRLDQLKCEYMIDRSWNQYRRVLQEGEFAEDYREIRDYVLTLKLQDRDLLKIAKVLFDKTNSIELEFKTDETGKIKVDPHQVALTNENDLFQIAVLPFLTNGRFFTNLLIDRIGVFLERDEISLAKAAVASEIKKKNFHGNFYQPLESVMVVQVYYTESDPKNPGSERLVYFNYWKKTKAVLGPYYKHPRIDLKSGPNIKK